MCKSSPVVLRFPGADEQTARFQTDFEDRSVFQPYVVFEECATVSQLPGEASFNRSRPAGREQGRICAAFLIFTVLNVDIPLCFNTPAKDARKTDHQGTEGK